MNMEANKQMVKKKEYDKRKEMDINKEDMNPNKK